jgi:hypothetical protein
MFDFGSHPLNFATWAEGLASVNSVSLFALATLVSCNAVMDLKIESRFQILRVYRER